MQFRTGFRFATLAVGVGLGRPVRPSHDTREQTIAELRRGYLAGRLGTDTFAHRLGDAFESPSREHLRGLTADLPAAPPRSLLGRLRARLSPRALPQLVGRLVTEAEVRAGDVVHLGGCRIRL